MLERESANCRVEVPKTGSGLVIMLEREITNGRVLCCDKIVKKRGIAKSVVAEPAGVVIERKGANSIFEFAVVVKDHRVSYPINCLYNYDALIKQLKFARYLKRHRIQIV